MRPGLLGGPPEGRAELPDGGSGPLETYGGAPQARSQVTRAGCPNGSLQVSQLPPPRSGGGSMRVPPKRVLELQHLV